ncbi:DUF5054 domain-containing protein [Devosia nitrariae]|uniref:DUF5054 domain-containing protein n=1 Tax=Devosia nitrariae TaxID=2071872 RepID=A0ABQ5WE59_9HYPH|nr:DUF5054 domain-containing protein [Devosia nitrariae]GLQ57871.1 hypothetical protein GCM10010862_51300 [Devosia nitrariae]
MTGKSIHLVFKTHLDIGFTDHAERVRRQYHEQFIPQALTTGEHFHAEDPANPRFVWTTGAWLIWDHLNTQDAEKVARLERAIERGLIRWHALPFTTHTELMSPALFRAGLSIGRELDERFGIATIAAKMTDVPGHTLGMVPILAKAGVRFLHLGVNTASPVPDVPDLFRWRTPAGEEIVVMYQNSYGATQFAPSGEVGLSFAHTNDNMGPQSVGQTVEVHRHMVHEHPDVEVRASTLDAFGVLMWERREEFPVVDLEIGDSWIHGAASDPIKLARFKALQRLYESFEADLTPQRRAFGRGLTLVAEHTWGVDIKTYLRDETAWDRPDFEAARAGDYRFAFTEASWAEQRAYIDKAIAELAPADRSTAHMRLDELLPKPTPDIVDEDERLLEIGGWTLALDATTGDVTQIVAPGGAVLTGKDGALVAYRYESYDSAALEAHLDTYLQHRDEWAILDHDKPGLSGARTARHETFAPGRIGGGWSDGNPVSVMAMPDEAHRILGAPERIELGAEALDDRRLLLKLTLRNKPANRMPEASFLSVTPEGATGWRYRKFDLWQPGDRVAHRGGGQLQAVEAVAMTLSAGTFMVEPLDAPLVGPAGRAFMPFSAAPPDLSAGIRFNLHNNKWGTNFTMWWEGDLVIRFVLTIG